LKGTEHLAKVITAIQFYNGERGQSLPETMMANTTNENEKTWLMLRAVCSQVQVSAQKVNWFPGKASIGQFRRIMFGDCEKWILSGIKAPQSKPYPPVQISRARPNGTACTFFLRDSTCWLLC
jgi:hypothetical protein